jgi:PBP1b-binding outer membrane lipoprotein LpoB
LPKKVIALVLLSLFFFGCAGAEKQVNQEISDSAPALANQPAKKQDTKKYPLVTGEFLYILK